MHVAPLVLLLSISLSAFQQISTLTVRVSGADGPLADARVRVGAQSVRTATDGRATLRVPPGETTVVVDRAGMLQQEATVVVAVTGETSLEVHLEPAPDVSEEVVVSATRAGKRVQDEPLRVETLDREEIEEKLMMTPGDIAMMLNETAGLRVQVTSPSLGGASLRIQGLRGRYTQLLSDGLPLYGGQSGSIGLLQIPPMDLRQVEVIKGVASSLFGSSALGGVVNLVSREPGVIAEREVLFNQTTQNGTDGVLWLSGPMRRHWGYTLLASGDRQSAHDVDHDGWADVARFSRASVRPRFFWNNGAGRSVFFTAGLMAEDRSGGTVGTVPQIGVPFVESLTTHRADGGVVARLLAGSRVIGIRGSVNVQAHTHQFGEIRERDRHTTGFTEVSLTGTTGRHTWVIGAAAQSDAYRAADVPRFNYTYWVPSVFAQDDVQFSPKAAMSISARYDQHSRFGAFVSPRVSLLVRPADGWTVRMSGGGGYFAPTALTDETEAAGLTRLMRADLDQPEIARSFSADLGRSIGSLELNGTIFGSRVDHPLAARALVGATGYELIALPQPTRTIGAEALVKIHLGDVTIVATHTYVRATEPDATTFARETVSLTPRHSSGIVTMWEREGSGRAGVELYYTGRQRLDHNPYRSTSEPYVYLGAMAERRIGSKLRVFVNSENLLDRRQTRYDSLVRPARNYDGRWTVDAWAPLEGRTANAGFRWMF
jgi:iron complex outermembrane receptor protein